MAQIIEIPGYGEVEFPDGMTDEQIVAAIQQVTGSPQAPAETYSPTEGMSKAQQYLAGIGRSFYELGRGIGQRAGVVSRADVDEARRLDAPLLSTGAGRAGNITGALAMAAPAIAIPGGQTVAGSALIGGVMGALQPTGTGESVAGNAVTGALASGGSTAAMGALSRVLKPVQTAVAPADARAIRTLQNAGVPLDAAQRSGSPGMARLKSGIGDNPFLVDRVAAQQAKQATGFNRAILRSIGETADSATDDVMGRAYTRIGNEFESILPQYRIKFSSKSETLANALAARSRRVLQGDSNQITKTIEDIRAHAAANGGAIDGRFYQTIRGDLGALERQPNVGPLAPELREGLDEAFQQTVANAGSPADAKRLLDARRQWRNMRIIENAVAPDGSGNISPAKLANQFSNKRNRAVGIYGKGDRSVVDLAKLAQSGKRILADKTPNSGTATRQMMNQSVIATALDAAGRVPLYQAIYGKGGGYLVNGIPKLNALAEPLRASTPTVNKLVPAYLLADTPQ